MWHGVCRERRGDWQRKPTVRSQPYDARVRGASLSLLGHEHLPAYTAVEALHKLSSTLDKGRELVDEAKARRLSKAGLTFRALHDLDFAARVSVSQRAKGHNRVCSVQDHSSQPRQLQDGEALRVEGDVGCADPEGIHAMRDGGKELSLQVDKGEAPQTRLARDAYGQIRRLLACARRLVKWRQDAAMRPSDA